MKILMVNEGRVAGWFDYKFNNWWDFINIYTRINLPEKSSYILKAKQDDAFRAMFVGAPLTKKSEFYIVEWNAKGPTIYPEGDFIRIKGKEYSKLEDFIKQYSWT